MKYPLPLRSKLHFVGVFLLLMAAALPGAAEPGTLQTWEQRYQRAEWVAQVRIEGVSSLINPSMSREQLVALQAYRYNASVVRHWKGEQNGTIKFQVDLSDCRQPLEVDGEYVVFGSSNHRGHLQSDSCEDLISIENATELELLPILEKLPQGSDLDS